MTKSEKARLQERSIINYQLQDIQEKINEVKNGSHLARLRVLQSIARNADKALAIIEVR